MSVEMITMLIGVVSILLALAGGFGWMIHRIDGVRDELSVTRRELGARIDGVSDEGPVTRRELGERIDRVEGNLGARVDKVTDELVEVKIAVARIEGPPRHLVTAR